MSGTFVCPECGSNHDEPAHAHLGHRLSCLQCALEFDVIAELATTVVADPDSALIAA